MKWVTRENANVDRIACPWLIRRFIDPEAEFVFVGREDVLEVAEREGAHSYDAPGAEYTHRDGKCSFEVLLERVRSHRRPGARPIGTDRSRGGRVGGRTCRRRNLIVGASSSAAHSTSRTCAKTGDVVSACGCTPSETSCSRREPTP